MGRQQGSPEQLDIRGLTHLGDAINAYFLQRAVDRSSMAWGAMDRAFKAQQKAGGHLWASHEGPEGIYVFPGAIPRLFGPSMEVVYDRAPDSGDSPALSLVLPAWRNRPECTLAVEEHALPTLSIVSADAEVTYGARDIVDVLLRRRTLTGTIPYNCGRIPCFREATPHEQAAAGAALQSMVDMARPLGTFARGMLQEASARHS